jgi:hypothetical protein
VAMEEIIEIKLKDEDTEKAKKPVRNKKKK